MRRCIVVLGSATSTIDAARSSPPIVTADNTQVLHPRGGHLDVSGEAEVGNPWTPAEMRCDAYCYMRARSFFDSVAVFGDDAEVHGMLADSIVPNNDYTQWTVTLRDGISFTDGTRSMPTL